MEGEEKSGAAEMETTQQPPRVEIITKEGGLPILSVDNGEYVYKLSELFVPQNPKLQRVLMDYNGKHNALPKKLLISGEKRNSRIQEMNNLSNKLKKRNLWAKGGEILGGKRPRWFGSTRNENSTGNLLLPENSIRLLPKRRKISEEESNRVAVKRKLKDISNALSLNLKAFNGRLYT